jgi:hypothetical protein
LDFEHFSTLSPEALVILTPLLLLGRRRGRGMRRCVLIEQSFFLVTKLQLGN